METIQLASSGRTTTRLGYGCSSLMGALGRRQSLQLLEAAYDAGIRHFDVAPSYGYGAAEGCVGEFRARHRGDVTVTTKFGIPAGKNQGLMNVARRVVGPVVKIVPGMKAKLARAANSVAASTSGTSYSVDEARVSLEHSLRELHAERVDVWLLHEAEAGDLNDELLRFCDDSVASGKIGSFGVGGEAAKIPAILAERPEFCDVVQCEWSVTDAKPALGAGFRIHHRALTENFRKLHTSLVENSELCRRWSESTGVNLGNEAALAQLMLKASLEENPDSVVLFSSKSAAHLKMNVAAAGDTALAGPAHRLYALVQSEPVLAEAVLV